MKITHIVRGRFFTYHQPRIFGGAVACLLACSPGDLERPSGTTMTGVDLGSTGDGTPSESNTATQDSSGQTTTTTGTSMGPSPGDGDSTSGGSPPDLPCDPAFAISPNPPGSGTVTLVDFTDDEPLVYVDLQANGPGVASITFVDVIDPGPPPYTWRWSVVGLAPGTWTLTFSHGETPQVLGTCQVWVEDTGLPPMPPPTGDCSAGQVCGDAGPGGGTCEHCPMVGQCLDPPSPYGPDGPGSWSCLDNAGCHPDNGQCQIWCPGEPCNNEEHPDGCPQGVEACFVDASFTSYEEACQSCCENRYHEPTGQYACWDTQYNLCRYPTDCGLPLWPF